MIDHEYAKEAIQVGLLQYQINKLEEQAIDLQDQMNLHFDKMDELMKESQLLGLSNQK